MYVKHSKLPLKYADSQKIWRYMDYEKFKSLIQEKSLFFCRADVLAKKNDKWEGAIPILMLEKFKLFSEEHSITSDDGNRYTPLQWHIQREGRSHLINCWHVNKTESFAMWKIYGNDQPRSIAIQSTIDRLKRSFDANKERIWIGEVEYIDFRRWKPDNRSYNIDYPNTLKIYFLKWHYYRFEREIRAVINKAYTEHKQKIGMKVEINIKELINRIYISPTSSNEDEQAIKNILAKNGYSFPISHSGINKPLYY